MEPATNFPYEELVDAIHDNDLASIKRLEKKYGPALLRMEDDPEQITSLHHAAAAGHADLVLYFLAPPINANPRAAHGNKFTPLHAASMHGHALIIQTLIQGGADVNAQTDPQLYAPLHSAAFAGHIDAIKVLLQNGADISRQNYRDETPAATAMRTGKPDAYKLLSE